MFITISLLPTLRPADTVVLLFVNNIEFERCITSVEDFFEFWTT